jgi:predicted DNA binding CopG/RHH family protein
VSKLKKLPRFKSEKGVLEFWATHDSTEYIDYSKAKRAIFPNLKPSTRTISIRLPESLIEHLKVLANKRDIPYQSLLKIFLMEKVKEEFHEAR